MLVGIERHRSFLGLQLDGQDLILEVALGYGVGRALVALYRKRILVGAGDAALGRDILRGDAHVDRVEGVGQSADHHVDVLGVAHARAPALRHVGVRGAAHAFRAAGDRRIDVAQHDVLRSGNDGLHPASAKTIQGERTGFGGQTGIERRDPRQVHVLSLGVNDVAKHALADVIGFDLGPADRFPHDPGTEFGWREILETAAIIADRRAYAAQDDDFFRFAHCCSPERIAKK